MNLFIPVILSVGSVFLSCGANAQVDFKPVFEANQILLQQVSAKNFDCELHFEPALAAILDLQKKLSVKDIEAAQRAIPQLFDSRLQLKQVVDLRQAHCLAKMRQYFFLSRSLQDQLYILIHSTEQKTIKGVDFLKIDVPQLKDPARALFNAKINNYELQPGDIMIAKGISFTSSTISQLALQPSQFSHIALFVNHEGRLHTLESYIGKGVDAYSLDDALKNENARILILRPKEAALASQASIDMDAIYSKSVSTKNKIKYDYKLDMKDHSELTCAEVAVTAFEKASAGKVIIPEFQSAVNFSNDDFVKKMGLRNGPMMMPDDMEFDSRFDTVLEWTEYTLLQDSLRKDQIMNFILKQINQKKDILDHSYKSMALDILWKTRNVSWLWPVSAKILGLAEDFDAGVPLETLKISLDVDSTGQKFLKRIYQEDTTHFELTGSWLTEQQLGQKIEAL